MAPRANWKGYLKIGELSCQVALYTAASTSDRVSFNIINRKTGNRVHREMIDSETGKPVESDDIIKGYEVSSGDYVFIDPEEIKAAVPQSDKTLELEQFIPCNGVDTIFLDKPYYLAPVGAPAVETFEAIRRSLLEKKAVGLARTVLFRRLRTLLIRPAEDGIVASTLNYDYEVRPAKEVFSDIGDFRIEGEMLDLARHIIETKRGSFDPTRFDDRYEAALAELVKAKIEGRNIRKAPAPAPKKVSSLLDALRQSAGTDTSRKKTSSKKPSPRKTQTRKSAPSTRKAG